MKRKREDLSVDQFLRSVDDTDDSTSERETNNSSPRKKSSIKQRKSIQQKKSPVKKKRTETTNSHGKQSKDEFTEHKESLKNLKNTDPAFYKFLEENDKALLNFDDDSSDSDGDSENVHQPPESLEIASDDSNAEDDDDVDETDTKAKSTKKRGRNVVTHLKIKRWQEQLKDPKPIGVLSEVVKALKAAVAQVEGGDTKDTGMKVSGSAVFNSVLRLCIVDVVPVFNRLLRAPPDLTTQHNFKPTSAKMWSKVHVPMKSYLTSSVKVLAAVAEPEIVRVLLKHTLQLVPYYTAFPKISKALTKRLIQFWCTGEEAVRVLALMAIVRITRNSSDELLQLVLKDMYLSYVKNCKFTSPSTWPVINFMKHSLVEVFALNQSLAYKHAFVYIRQLAIHLRNAITVKKKDVIKTVYNWQFIHCLYLWSQLLSTINPSDILEPLIYPLVQIIMGTCKLVPTAKYIPLRFHCIRALTMLGRETNVFIPVFPLLLEGVEFVDFNKKHTRISWKPMEFLCVLKLSKAQLAENAFKDAVMDQFYELIMDYAHTQCHTIGFPELILPTVIQMKSILKKNKVANYNKQVKQLVDKLEENGRFVDERRRSTTINLADQKAVDAWENEARQSGGLPLSKYYAVYRKLRDRELAQGISKKDLIASDDLPPVKRRELMQKHKDKDRLEMTELFAEDSNDSDGGINFHLKDDEDDSDENEGTEEDDDDDDGDSSDDDGSESEKREKHKTEQRSGTSPKKKVIPRKIESMEECEDVVEELKFSSDEDDGSDD